MIFVKVRIFVVLLKLYLQILVSLPGDFHNANNIHC